MTASIGLLVLAGWLLGIASLRSLGLPGVTMKANTSLSFLLLGAALVVPAGASPRARLLAAGLSAAVAAVGFLTLGEYLLVRDLGIDQVLSREAPGAYGTTIPGRMAPNTALAFLFLGIGLLFVDRETRRGTRPAECFAFAAGIGAWIAFLGTVHGDPPFFGLEAYTRMAIPTIFLFLLASVGLALARPDRGLAALLSTSASGGALLRVLVPTCLVLPAFIGWVFTQGERRGLFDARFGTVLVVLAISILFLSAVGWAILLILRKEDVFLATFEEAPVGIAHVGLDGRYLRINEKFRSITGYSRDEMLARTYREITHPDDRPADEENHREFLAGRRDAATLEKRYIRKDGSSAWVRLTSSVVRLPLGAPNYFIAVVEDVSERKRIEAERERLMAAIEQTHEVVMITDTKGIIEYANPAFERVTGYTRTEAVGRPVRLLSSGRHSPAFYKDLWETLLLRGERWSGTFINRKKDGTTYEETTVISPVRDFEGRTTHFVAVRRDRTVEREAEKARSLASRETERADRAEAQFLQSQKMEAVGRLAGGVAHDFNNLLTVIQSNVEILLEDLGEKDLGRDLVSEIRDSAHRAAGLTRQLLAFSRRQVLDPRVFALDGVVANSVWMLRRLVGEHISVRTLLSPDAGRVRADPGQIEQVILNLAVNARDAMPNGGRLTFETSNVILDGEYGASHPEATPGPHVLLAVSDTGAGMDEETRTRIFEPFFTTKERGRGTGLGLSTVYGIIRQSGGHITVYSEPGHGTIFKIYLPRVSAPAEIDTPAPKVEVPRGTETILLVEDESAVRAAARRALERNGYTVIEAADAEDAVRLFLRHGASIRLLLTDVVMPRASGPELAEKFVRARPDLKILFISGYTEDGIVHHGVLDPGVHFLQKPFTGDSLGRKVREVLDA